MTSMLRTLLNHKLFIAFELFCLGVLIPTLVLTLRLAPYMFGFLWGAALYSFAVYRLLYAQPGEQLWRWSDLSWAALRPIVLRWLLCCVLLLSLTALLFPDKLFGLFSQKPEMIPFLLVMYPVVSALPQEFIFCSYFFKRYGALWRYNERITVWVSALTFAYVHVLFINWVAPVLSLIGGYIFARTYQRTRSLAIVTAEHGLYGNALFLVGLGWFFWGGSIRQ